MVSRRHDRDIRLLQLRGVDVGTAFFAAEQDTEIAVFRRTGHAVFRNRQGSDQLLYPSGDETGFTRVPLFQRILQGVGIEDGEFGLVSRPARVCCAGNQRFSVAVGDAGRLFRHELTEEKIDAVRHFGAAAEIVTQSDGGGVGRSVEIRPAVPLLQK